LKIISIVNIISDEGLDKKFKMLSCDSLNQLYTDNVTKEIANIIDFYVEHKFITINPKVIIDFAQDKGNHIRVKSKSVIEPSEIIIKIISEGMIGQYLINFLFDDPTMKQNQQLCDIVQNNNLPNNLPNNVHIVLCFMMYKLLDKNVYKNNIHYQKIMKYIDVIENSHESLLVDKWPNMSIPAARYACNKINHENHLGAVNWNQIINLCNESSESFNFHKYYNYLKSHKWQFMLPIMDLINHSINNNAIHVHNIPTISQNGDATSDHYLKSVCQINSGEEILINYSIGHCDIQRLTNYGIVDEYNENTIAHLFFSVSLAQQHYIKIKPIIQENIHFFDGDKLFFPIHLNIFNYQTLKPEWLDPLILVADIIKLIPLFGCYQCDKFQKLLTSIMTLSDKFKNIILLNYKKILINNEGNIIGKLDFGNNFINEQVFRINTNQSRLLTDFVNHHLTESINDPNVTFLSEMINTDFIKPCSEHTFVVYIGAHQLPVINLFKTN